MNFLGHLYLSGNDPLTITGNFMGDDVKGRDLSAWPEGIQRGLRLHRAIDQRTDQHPVQRAGRARVRPHAGRYAGVVMDLFYDHLLARDWDRYSDEPLPQFTARMYALLNDHRHLMPAPTRDMLHWMERGDWLNAYATVQGIGQALEGLSHRAVAGAPMRGAEQVLLANMDDYRREFATFLPDLRTTAQDLL
jgi:acyl carrier protein phosphodiesterase